jgi:hypothetical protein
LSQKLNYDAKNIGARFRSARSLVPNHNRKSFCERYEINRYTMQSWENGLHVSKGKNVEKFIEALAREGVFCTSEWLIDGTGEPAKPLKGTSREPTGTGRIEGSPKDPDEKFLGLISTLQDAYQALGQDLISCVLPDDAMAPKFLFGDMVFGVVKEDKAQVHQKHCVIELTPEKRIVRKVLVTKDNYILVALDDRIPMISLGLTTRIYEIVWHWVNQT